VAQFLAAFPANLLFPPFVLTIVHFDLNPNIWLTPLMILGTQWYILFNVVAGAAAFPGDLREASSNLGIYPTSPSGCRAHASIPRTVSRPVDPAGAGIAARPPRKAPYRPNPRALHCQLSYRPQRSPKFNPKSYPPSPQANAGTQNKGRPRSLPVETHGVHAHAQPVLTVAEPALSGPPGTMSRWTSEQFAASG
jgi:hypothetical protein